MTKRFILLTICLLLLMAGCSQGNGEDQGDEDDKNGTETETGFDIDELKRHAEAYIQELADGEYEKAVERFDETMASQIGSAELQELWETLESQAGAFVDQEYHGTQPVEGYQVVIINGLFEGADVVFTVTFDKDYQIAGFYIQ